jgi:hypothetical protein
VFTAVPVAPGDLVAGHDDGRDLLRMFSKNTRSSPCFLAAAGLHKATSTLA